MAKPKVLTPNGHDLFEISSLLQKAIRRGHVVYAGYAACELMVRYRKYLWKRLLIISAEDCFDLVTKEIVALKQADEMEPNPIFVAKAVTILLRARKNRDADWLACNTLNGYNVLNVDKANDILDFDECKRQFRGIPQYTYDCHTVVGKMRGKTKADMIRDEQNALYPKVDGWFDDYRWDRFFFCEENGFYDKSRPFAEKPSDDVMNDVNEGGFVEGNLFD